MFILNMNFGLPGLLLPVGDFRLSKNINLISGYCTLNTCLIVVWIKGPCWCQSSAQFENPQSHTKFKKYFPVFTIICKYIIIGIKASFWAIWKKTSVFLDWKSVFNIRVILILRGHLAKHFSYATNDRTSRIDCVNTS